VSVTSPKQCLRARLRSSSIATPVSTSEPIRSEAVNCPDIRAWRPLEAGRSIGQIQFSAWA
jgi:hypothetical protein